jgi:hypothetical protein
MTDPLAQWWVHQFSVRRLSGSGAGGDVFTPAAPADPATLVGFWADGATLVRDMNGEEVTSSARVAHPITDARIPPGSLVIAPAAFGGGTFTVIATARGDGGGQPTPDHWEISLR